MSAPEDEALERLLGGSFDREVIARLAAADRAKLRALLAKYLRDEEVERALARIDELVRASR